MKKLFYSLFAFLFRVFRLFPVKDNLAVFLAPHNGGEHDSLSELKSYVDANTGLKTEYLRSFGLGAGDLFSFFFRGAYLLARAKYVFLNDNFMPLSSLSFSGKTIITQLWHGEGAFKKFGLMTDLPAEIKKREIKSGKKLTYIVCSSENVRDIYSQAFGTDRERILPLGSARLDYLMKINNSPELREKFNHAFPSRKGKKIVLWAPTFRDDEALDSEITSRINIDMFNRELGDECVLMIKLHPQVHSSEVPAGAIDVTEMDMMELTAFCDILITDYSSACMLFAALGKPCVFYCYDIDSYRGARDFCFGYEDYIPGPAETGFEGVISDIKAILKGEKNPRNDEKLIRFRDFNFDYIDSRNCERIAKAIISQDNFQ